MQREASTVEDIISRFFWLELNASYGVLQSRLKCMSTMAHIRVGERTWTSFSVELLAHNIATTSSNHGISNPTASLLTAPSVLCQVVSISPPTLHSLHCKSTPRGTASSTGIYIKALSPQ